MEGHTQPSGCTRLACCAGEGAAQGWEARPAVGGGLQPGRRGRGCLEEEGVMVRSPHPTACPEHSPLQGMDPARLLSQGWALTPSPDPGPWYSPSLPSSMLTSWLWPLRTLPLPGSPLLLHKPHLPHPTLCPSQAVPPGAPVDILAVWWFLSPLSP